MLSTDAFLGKSYKIKKIYILLEPLMMAEQRCL